MPRTTLGTVALPRVLAAACLAALLALVTLVPASGAAGPRYILVHGGGLASPVLLDDAAGNALLVSSPDILPLAGVPRAADRPVYELALFFIVPDLAGRSPSSLKPEETTARGRFFPAVGEHDAVFELGAVPGIGPRRDGGLTPPMLDYLVSRGIPVVSNVVLGPEPTPTPTADMDIGDPSPGAAGSGGRGWVMPAVLSAALLVLLVGGLALRSRRKPRRRELHW